MISVERLGFSDAWIDTDITDTTRTDASTRNKPTRFIFGRAFGVSLNLKYACGRFFINKQIITYKGSKFRDLAFWPFRFVGKFYTTCPTRYLAPLSGA